MAEVLRILREQLTEVASALNGPAPAPATGVWSLFHSERVRPAATQFHKPVSVAAHAIVVVRDSLGYVLPSRMIADLLIGIVLVALIGVTLVSVITNCKTFTCSFLKLGLLCVLLIVAAWWLMSLLEISEAEFGGIYSSAWYWCWNMIDRLAHGRADQ